MAQQQQKHFYNPTIGNLAHARSESNHNNNNTLNQTRSVDFHTNTHQDGLSNDSNIIRDNENFFEEEELEANKFELMHRYAAGSKGAAHKDDQLFAGLSQGQKQQQLSNEQEQQQDLQQQKQQKRQTAGGHHTNQASVQSYAGTNSTSDLLAPKDQFAYSNLHSNKYQQQQQQQQHIPSQQQQQQQQSDKKVWAVSGQLPGSTSKKFVRDYKLGRYKKIQSLKNDMEYLNSPHHEQKHLGNTIFPFQNNSKSRFNTYGSFDYRKLTQQDSTIHTGITSNPTNHSNKQLQGGKQQQQRIFSPHTTSRQVTQQVLRDRTSGSTHKKNNEESDAAILPQQIEIRYIDLIQQPLIKPNKFVDNKLCAHSMTNLRHTAKKMFFASSSSVASSQDIGMGMTSTTQFDWKSKPKANHYYKPSTASAAASMQDENPSNKQNNNVTSESQYYQTDAVTSSLQPKTIFLDPNRSGQVANFGKSASLSRLSQKEQLLRSSQLDALTKQQNPRLPPFAAVPENISFFSKAKSNLVKYVNDIGVKENPLMNTFVVQRKLF